jgi:stage II sporulation protein D
MRERETKEFSVGPHRRKVELSVQPFDADISRVRLLASILLGTAVLNLACAAPHAMRREGPAHGRVRVQLDKQIVSVPIDEYVRVVILSEFSPGPAEPGAVEKMLELQAVVSRTYALFPRHRGQGFDFCASTHCQLYDPSGTKTARWAAAAARAARNTSGVVLWFDRKPARIAFHADCGGRTSAARDVWSGLEPSYLAALDDGGPAAVAHSTWRFAPPRPALLAALNADARTRVGKRLDRIDVVKRDDGGRVQVVALKGERAPLVRGEDLRAVLTRAFGFRALGSTRFDVAPLKGTFEFSGRGLGHGVGLCQVGAFARISAGANPADVLAHYFPGTSAH